MTTQPPTAIKFDELESFDDFIKAHSNITRNQLEWMYRNRTTNGLKASFCKIGKRRYVIAPILVSLLVNG
jgi:hypothetical protein